MICLKLYIFVNSVNKVTYYPETVLTDTTPEHGHNCNTVIIYSCFMKRVDFG